MTKNIIKHDFIQFLNEQANLHHNPLAVIVRYFFEAAYDLAIESVETTLKESNNSPAASHFALKFIQYRWIIALADHIGIGTAYPLESAQRAVSITKVPPLNPPPFDHNATSFIEACGFPAQLHEVFKTLCDSTSPKALRAASCIFGYGFAMSKDTMVLLDSFLLTLPQEEQKVSVAMAYAEEQLKNWLMQSTLTRWRNIVATADHLLRIQLKLADQLNMDNSSQPQEKLTLH